jgi:hypothetical protein
MMSPLMQWPFKRVCTCTEFMIVYDLIDQQSVLNSRQTDIQTVQTMDTWPKNSLRVVGSVLCNGLHINTLMSCCRETWAGNGWRMWGWGVAGKPRPVLDSKENFVCRNSRAGRFQWWSWPGVKGLMYAPLHPPPLDELKMTEILQYYSLIGLYYWLKNYKLE